MIDKENKTEWRIIGKSVRGDSHQRKSVRKQDAIGWIPNTKLGTSLIMAVADGHGSTTCFRSHLGARFAVQVAILELSYLLNDKYNLPVSSTVKQMTE